MKQVHILVARSLVAEEVNRLESHRVCLYEVSSKILPLLCFFSNFLSHFTIQMKENRAEQALRTELKKCQFWDFFSSVFLCCKCQSHWQ